MMAGALTIFAATAGDFALSKAPSESVDLRGIAFDPNSGLVTLRWRSQLGKTYTIEETTNPELGWEQNVRGISGISGETTLTVLPRAASYGAKNMLFRIRELSETETPSEKNADGGSHGKLAGKDALQKATSGIDGARRAGSKAAAIKGLATTTPRSKSSPGSPWPGIF